MHIEWKMGSFLAIPSDTNILLIKNSHITVLCLWLLFSLKSFIPLRAFSAITLLSISNLLVSTLVSLSSSISCWNILTFLGYLAIKVEVSRLPLLALVGWKCLLYFRITFRKTGFVDLLVTTFPQNLSLGFKTRLLISSGFWSRKEGFLILELMNNFLGDYLYCCLSLDMGLHLTWLWLFVSCSIFRSWDAYLLERISSWSLTLRHEAMINLRLSISLNFILALIIISEVRVSIQAGNENVFFCRFHFYLSVERCRIVWHIIKIPNWI